MKEPFGSAQVGAQRTEGRDCMEELAKLLDEALSENLSQIILSNTRDDAVASKAKIRPVLIGEELKFQEEILSQLGINPYFAREYDIALRNYPMRRTMKIISILREYDYKSKSNARDNASDGELLTELISRILA